VNQALIAVSKGLFSYQIFVRAVAKPTVHNLLGETIESSDRLRDSMEASLSRAAANSSAVGSRSGHGLKENSPAGRPLSY
jgi:hypothetical protein